MVPSYKQKLNLTGEEAFMAPTTTKKWSVFALEHKQWKDVHFELSARADQQEIDVDDNSKQDFDGSAFPMQVLPTGSLRQIISFHL